MSQPEFSKKSPFPFPFNRFPSGQHCKKILPHSPGKPLPKNFKEHHQKKNQDHYSMESTERGRLVISQKTDWKCMQFHAIHLVCWKCRLSFLFKNWIRLLPIKNLRGSHWVVGVLWNRPILFFRINYTSSIKKI